jgi:hypothetical protein
MDLSALLEILGVNRIYGKEDNVKQIKVRSPGIVGDTSNTMTVQELKE